MAVLTLSFPGVLHGAQKGDALVTTHVHDGAEYKIDVSTLDDSGNMALKINGAMVDEGDYFLDIQFSGPWCVLHYATDYDRTTFYHLYHLVTGKQSMLAMVNGGWDPSSPPVCQIDMEKAEIRFHDRAESISFDDALVGLDMARFFINADGQIDRL